MALVDLYVDGEVISTTGEHPFWTPDKGWVEAKDLQVGSLLQTEDGRIIDVDRIEKGSLTFTTLRLKASQPTLFQIWGFWFIILIVVMKILGRS
ncbi:polymorphic toxin-type HINT domain-containing protein [Nostoc sp. GT001]|uniref:polymorphic toxin-type HINT domain-containing protein n=1 Tax=Nostoc sp. GT001 TaxID=3056647 RepID=UPI0025AB2FB1|nr:polymorphic toxin-type HINT domain-containing protein [Nostoc sp. GT001]MDM9580202.1 polymorphic toxin-type HINT domain-containing protein [Nostoc sp. GT001]